VQARLNPPPKTSRAAQSALRRSTGPAEYLCVESFKYRDRDGTALRMRDYFFRFGPFAQNSRERGWMAGMHK
jgi:hypothetical protein